MRVGDLWFNENTKGERKKQMLFFPFPLGFLRRME